MLEDQGFKSLKVYNQRKKIYDFPGVDLAGADHQKIEQIEESEDQEYEYNNNNSEGFYDKYIDCNEDIYRHNWMG